MLSNLTLVLIILTLCLSVSHAYLVSGGIFYKKPANCTNPNGKLGICISIHQCETLQKVLRNRIESSYEFIKLSQCQNDSELPWTAPFVCCCNDTAFNVKSKKKPRQHRIIFPSTSTATQLPPDPVVETVDVTENDVEPQLLLPKKPNCGAITISNKIYGGVEAELAEFSWMVNLEYRKANGMLVSSVCAGSLINNQYVITAAHCVKGKIEVKIGNIESVIVGDHNTATDIDCNDKNDCLQAAQRFGIESITAHEGFNMGMDKDINQHNDIALIRLDRKVNFTDDFDALQPVCLPSMEQIEELRSGTIFTVAGWGHNGTTLNTDEKRKVSVPYVEQDVCREKFSKILNVADEQLCAGGVFRKDSCRGDSGGPLMRLSNGTWLLEGIVSFGRGCGLEKPAIYTRLRSYLDWIKNNIKP